MLVSFLALIALAALASSLHDVNFQPGRRLPALFSADSAGLANPAALLEQISDIPLWKIIAFWAVCLINIFIFLYLLPPEIRRRLIRQIVRFAVGILLLFLIFHYHLIQLPGLNLNAAGQTGAQSALPDAGVGQTSFQPPQIQPWLIYLFSFAVSLLLLVLAGAAYRQWTRLRSRRFSHLDEIAAIARSSLNELAGGHAWDNVVIQAYVRMSEVVGVKRGLRRGDDAARICRTIGTFRLAASGGETIDEFVRVGTVWFTFFEPAGYQRGAGLPEFHPAGMRGDAMIKLRGSLLIGALSLSLIMAFLLRDVVYRIVVVPLAYLWFVIKFYYSVIPQLLLWVVLLIGVFMALLSSLAPPAPSIRRGNRKRERYSWPIGSLAIWLIKSRNGNYFKWQVAHRLGRIARGLNELSAAQRRFEVRNEAVEKYLDAGLNTSFMDYPRPSNPLRRPAPTVLDLDPKEAVDYLEALMENHRDRHP